MGILSVIILVAIVLSFIYSWWKKDKELAKQLILAPITFGLFYAAIWVLDLAVRDTPEYYDTEKSIEECAISTDLDSALLYGNFIIGVGRKNHGEVIYNLYVMNEDGNYIMKTIDADKCIIQTNEDNTSPTLITTYYTKGYVRRYKFLQLFRGGEDIVEKNVEVLKGYKLIIPRETIITQNPI